ncbi:MAG: acyltransferase [Sphingomonadaceae bacterium]|nr:acyltransferase [Sphingomonadaceae bacterium]
MRPAQNSVDWLDYARFLAAFSVMVFHYTANGIRRGVIENYDRFGAISNAAEYGYLGVDLFFLISGYVIALTSSGKDAPTFAISRFVRLWPTFLLCLVATTLVRVCLGGPQFEVSLAQFIVNTTMLAPYLGFDHIDSVYWTLAYELGFYGLVFVAILLGLKARLEQLMVLWLLAIIAFDVLGANLPLIGNYNYLFVIGFLLQRIEQSGWSLWRALPLLVASAFAIMASVERAAQMSLNRGDFMLNPIIVGAATAVFILAFLFFGQTRLKGLRLPGARRLGLMTYPLYLLHAYIGYVLLNRFATEANKVVVVCGMFAFMLFLSYSVTRFFEEPVLPRIRDSLANVSTGMARKLASKRA